jgi:hypothetical protein
MKTIYNEYQKNDSKVLAKTSKYVSEKFQFLTNSKAKTTVEIEESNELTDPRFEIKAAEETSKTSNSLLFLMYSEENNALFI